MTQDTGREALREWAEERRIEAEYRAHIFGRKVFKPGSELAESMARDAARYEHEAAMYAAVLALLAQPEAPSPKHANEIAYFLRNPQMGDAVKRERLAALVERLAQPEGERRPAPDGYVSAATAFDLRVRGDTVSARTIWKNSAPDHDVPVYLGAPATAEATERSES